MRIQITKPGIYDGEGKEVPVGTELTVTEEPKGWRGRYSVLSEGGKGKTAVTNPKEETAAVGPFSVKDDGKGWWSVYAADGSKVKSLREDDARAFSELSADDQAAFLAEG